MKKIILMLWALAALVGCSKHEQPVAGNPNLAVELSGSLNNAGVTRSDGVIEGDAPESALQIDVFRTDMVSSSYPNTEWDLKLAGTLGTDKSITLDPTQYFLDDATQSSRFIGVYPKGEYDKSNRTITYTALDGAMDVAVSDFAEGHISSIPNKLPEYTDQTLLFSHLLTKIAVKLMAKDTEIINSKGKITSIDVVNKKTGAIVTLPAANAANATGVSIAATAGDPTDLPLTTLKGGEPTPVLLTNTATTFGYAMFLPVESDGTLTLKIHFENSDHNPMLEVTTADAQKYEAGKGYSITVAFETTTQVSAEVVALKGAFNLWNDETTAQVKDEVVVATTPQAMTGAPDGLTNAYMVAPERVLKFKVARAYKFENDAFTDKLRATDAAYSDEFTAEVLWADAAVIDGDITVTGSGKDAVVSLKTTNTPGNAVVAIKKKDPEIIVWSYHIWVTDYDLEEKTKNTQSGLTFMSRNLGAKADDLSVDAYGLYYQWGRKDPFPGVDNPGGGADVITKEETDATKGTVSYSIQHPATFICGVSGNSWDWLYAARQDDLWGQGADKSVYDPCPSGWRVPDFTDGNSPWKGFTKDNGAWSDDGGKGWDWSSADNLLSSKQYGAYPAAGSRLAASGALDSTGSDGRYWSSATTGVNGYLLAFNSTDVGSAGYLGRARGFSVRCVSEQ
jgi:uncharacterized protein (TIGR02145 family)